MKKKKRLNGGRLSLLLSISVTVFFLLFYTLFRISTSGWNGNSRYTVVMQNIASDIGDGQSGLGVLTIEPKQNSAVFLFLPPNFMMDIPYGYRTYPVFSIYKLGQLDQRRGGGYLLKKSVETTLGIKADRFILFSENSSTQTQIPVNDQQLSLFKRNKFTLMRGLGILNDSMGNRLTTDLKFLELVRLFFAFRGLRLDQIDLINLGGGQAVHKEKLADESSVFILDTEVFDHEFADKFYDLLIRKEAFTLEVQNATGVMKIAGQFARILEHLGANVVSKSTAESINSTACRIIFYKEGAKSSIIGRVLIKDYGCVEDEIDRQQPQSDIKVIIGKGFLE